MAHSKITDFLFSHIIAAKVPKAPTEMIFRERAVAKLLSNGNRLHHFNQFAI